MNIALNILLCGIFLIVLIYSAKLVEHSFVQIGKIFRINEFFLEFVVLGIVTTLPEISIAIFSSEHHPEISAGNLIGATTVILTLIIGLSAIKYKVIKFQSSFTAKEIVGGIATIFVAVFALVDGGLSYVEGIILILTYVGYLVFLNRKMWKLGRQVLYLTLDNTSIYRLIIVSIIGAFMLLFSSSQIVNNLEVIVESLGISGTFVGLVLLSMGTNLPEITILMTAKGGSEEELALGNFFGSACVNVGVLGLLALISNGFQIQDASTMLLGLFFLFFALILFIFFILSERSINKKEGILLVTIYVAMIISQIILVL
jgi:cation:H+ antiporter